MHMSGWSTPSKARSLDGCGLRVPNQCVQSRSWYVLCRNAPMVSSSSPHQAQHSTTPCRHALLKVNQKFLLVSSTIRTLLRNSDVSHKGRNLTLASLVNSLLLLATWLQEEAKKQRRSEDQQLAPWYTALNTSIWWRNSSPRYYRIHLLDIFSFRGWEEKTEKSPNHSFSPPGPLNRHGGSRSKPNPVSSMGGRDSCLNNHLLPSRVWVSKSQDWGAEPPGFITTWHLCVLTKHQGLQQALPAASNTDIDHV